ncbi:hypothetical protein QC334_10155 [Streptomyces sp. DH18]|uniref:hypothetical protein n=1 Tax=unclassified Streptomyces TaxID=2593676 RepID=UPI001E4FC346|nr:MULTISPECIES: hypothetical protein [unclassified Streptomyces]MDG9683096.1 hypothetical protein [Streptomyces sp. DH18]
MRRKRSAIASLACAAALVSAGASPASAAVPQNYFVGSTGSTGGYSQGTVTFHNRTVQISGAVKSNTTGCVQVEFQGTVSNFAHYERRTACGRGTGSSKDFGFTFPSYVGGYSHVVVQLSEVTSTGTHLKMLDTTTRYPG